MSQISESIIDICQGSGMQFRKIGTELYARCPFHDDGKKPNFRVKVEDNSWFCDVCDTGGGPVEFVSKKTGRDKKEVYKEMIQKQNGHTVTANSQGGPKPKIIATYDYTDAMGNMLYQVCRFDPKDFRQRRKGTDGEWIWKLEGVERVLYKLPELLSEKAMLIWIVEGEKDVETLRDIRQVATTNVGGAKKWSDAYSQTLKGKEVAVCGDNDEAGREHAKRIIESLEPYAKAVRHVQIPAGFKDVSDYRKSFDTNVKFAEAMEGLFLNAPVIGVASLPIKSIVELRQEYIEHIKSSKTRLLNLKDWIPALGCVRPLVSGELVSIIGDTGTSKTYVLQQIAYMCKVPTLLFEMELPGALTYERFIGLARSKSGAEVEAIYQREETMDDNDLSHVYTCTKAGLTAAMIESLILKSELKIGVRPVLVEIDYVQLARGEGKSRYERISNFVEEIKIVAKNTGTVVIMVSQIAARDKKSPQVTLHDAKDSGSIENSSGVVIGMWRDEKDANTLCLKVLKCTKGKPSEIIYCNIEERTMWITEKSKIDGQDTIF
jgi:5S rRNA maturation endonuclease (ribonuclease M5)